MREFQRRMISEKYGGYAQQYLFHHARTEPEKNMNTGFIDVVLSPAEIDLLPEREMGECCGGIRYPAGDLTMITALAHGAAGCGR